MLLSTDSAMGVTGFDSPQCGSGCWDCLGIDVEELKKYGISTEMDPLCKGQSMIFNGQKYEAIKRKKAYFQKREIFQRICGIDGHLDLDEILKDFASYQENKNNNDKFFNLFNY